MTLDVRYWLSHDRRQVIMILYPYPLAAEPLAGQGRFHMLSQDGIVVPIGAGSTATDCLHPQVGVSIFPSSQEIPCLDPTVPQPSGDFD